MLPGRVQPSTFGTERLNFCVRDGNRWDPLVIATVNGELFTCGEKEQNCFLLIDTSIILFCIKSIASKGRPEGFQRAIGKPFGRARRRETSALGKAIVLSENSLKGQKHQPLSHPFIRNMFSSQDFVDTLPVRE